MQGKVLVKLKENRKYQVLWWVLAPLCLRFCIRKRFAAQEFEWNP
ncbi:hypothetical protein [Wolbachia endosymbiont (group A) of Tiphia femorata]|nr:hypothetical protein [Wolbachia endosymbiont (group A) of Tiphia femorata]